MGISGLAGDRQISMDAFVFLRRCAHSTLEGLNNFPLVVFRPFTFRPYALNPNFQPAKTSFAKGVWPFTPTLRQARSLAAP